MIFIQYWLIFGDESISNLLMHSKNMEDNTRIKQELQSLNTLLSSTLKTSFKKNVDAIRKRWGKRGGSGGRTIKYRMIQDPQYNGIFVSRKEELLGVSRRTYYKWLHRPLVDSEHIQLEMQLRDTLQKITLEFPGYGHRKMTVELQNQGYLVNHKKVLRLMKGNNLLRIRKRLKPLTTDSHHPHTAYSNLLRYQKIPQPNQGWASDITYIQLPDSFVYLAVILDAYTQKCIGWNTSLDTTLAVDALHQALRNRWRQSMTELIHHSNQGVQYASHAYAALWENNRI